MTSDDAPGSGSERDLRARPRRLEPIETKQPQLAMPNFVTSYLNMRIADIVGPGLKSIQDSFAAQLAPIAEALSRLSLGSARFAASDASANTAYSEEMKSPQDYFDPNEGVINSFDDLHGAIQRLISKNPALQILWRGQRNAGWGLHSSLFRVLMDANGVRPPSKPHRRLEPYPLEDQLVAAEQTILQVAGDRWRFDGTNALEIFARLQHFGAPTRLLDVTRNPYIAAWFAVERSEEDEDHDGRLFALATHPVLPSDQREVALSLTQIRGATAQGPTPFWHGLGTNEARAQLQWGTGQIRRYWVPPAFEQRILAQNGAFVVDGVPISSKGVAAYFKKPGSSSDYWKRADLLAASSIYTKVYSPERKVRENKARAFPPTFTYRITSEAKRDIREVLEKRFYYSAETLYPDTEGLAQYLRDNLGNLLGPKSRS